MDLQPLTQLGPMIFIGMMVAFMVVLLFGVLTDREPE